MLALGFGLLALWPERERWAPQGRRRAMLALSLGLLGIAAGNLVAIAAQGGGLGALGPGAWLGLAGGLIGLACADAVPPDIRSGQAWTGLPAPALVALLVAAIAVGLRLVVVGLDVDEGAQFLSYLAALAAAGVALSAVGLLPTVSLAGHRFRWVLVIGLAVAAIAFPFTQNGNQQWLNLAAQIGVLTAAAIGLNVVVGLAGLLDLGYVAFYGIGAYTAALLSGAVFTTVHVHVPFVLVLLLGAALAGLFGALLGAPTLRLRGDYLAIVTLGFGEIFTLIVTNWDGLTRGPNGISGIPDLMLPGGFDFGTAHTLFGVELPSFANYYFLALALIGVVAAVFTNLNHSRVGRAWIAIREDEVAARAMGVNTVNYKLLAFTIGAVLAGTAGMLNAHVAKSVTPDSYTFLVSVALPGRRRARRHGDGARRRRRHDAAAAHPGEAALLRRQAVAALRDRADPADALPAGGPDPEPAPPPRAASRRAAGWLTRDRRRALPPHRHRAGPRGRGGRAVTDPSLLVARDVTKRFGGLLAVDRVSLTVHSDEIVGLIGPNGAGKTTLFNCLTGMVAPTSGTVTFRGRRLAGTPDRITKAGVARTFQNIRLFADMTVLENVLVGRHLHTREGLLAAIGHGVRFRRAERAARSQRTGAARVRGPARQGRRAGPQPGLRRPAPSRDRPGVGHRAGPAAPRRAHRRHEPAGDRGHRGSGPARARRRPGRGGHRARHAFHLRGVRPGRRARAGGGARDRLPAAGAGRPAGHRGLPRLRRASRAGAGVSGGGVR